MGLSFVADYDSERVCRWGVFLDSVRLMGSTQFDAFPFWMIFSHITLERSWVIGFCLHLCWMYVATAIIYSELSLHKRQHKLIDVIDRHVMIFLTAYFRTTPMADVNFTSLITCHHCVSCTVALVICILQRILKEFTSLVAQRVFFDDADHATCKLRVGLPYSVLPFAELTIFVFGCKRTIVPWIHAIWICITLLWRHCIVYCIVN